MRAKRWLISAEVLLILCVVCRAQQSAVTSGQLTLPVPTGEYQVGRKSFYLVDPARTDLLGSRGDHRRELMVEVWYPASAISKEQTSDWFPSAWAAQESKGLLGMLLSRAQNPPAGGVQQVAGSVKAHAREMAPLAKSSRPFPVLVFSSGNRMFPAEYSSLLEDLASHGYVVVGHAP